TQDAAPPELLPLKMAVAAGANSGPIEAHDDRSQRIVAELEKLVDMSFPNATPLDDVIKYVRRCTTSRGFPDGIPIYIDPLGLQEAEKSVASTVSLDLAQVPLRASLRLLLEQLGLTYQVKDGLLKITSMGSEATSGDDDQPVRDGSLDGMAGMGGMGLTGEPAEASRGTILNQEAASDQAEELRVADGPGPGQPAAEKAAARGTFSTPSHPS